MGGTLLLASSPPKNDGGMRLFGGGRQKGSAARFPRRCWLCTTQNQRHDDPAAADRSSSYSVADAAKPPEAPWETESRPALLRAVSPPSLSDPRLELLAKTAALNVAMAVKRVPGIQTDRQPRSMAMATSSECRTDGRTDGRMEQLGRTDRQTDRQTAVAGQSSRAQCHRGRPCVRAKVDR
jgi:hypothetical protein